MSNTTSGRNRAARLRTLRAVVVALACASPLAAGNISGETYVETFSSRCYTCPGIDINTFGTTSYGSPGANDLAQTIWFHDHIGMYARGSMNSLGTSGGNGYAYGRLFEPLLVPVQQGMSLGDPGVLELKYHLDGTVNIDVADTHDNLGQLTSHGEVDLKWFFLRIDFGPGPTVTTLDLIQLSWQGNHLSDVVDRDVNIAIPIQYGVPFYYTYEFNLSAFANSQTPPSVGFAEGDFLHTGTLLGAVVFDSSGNPISNPVVISDSGFDFVHPQGSPSSVPEPGGALLFAVGLTIIRLTSRSSRHPANGGART